MKLIVANANEVSSWERLAMAINIETRTSMVDRHPQVEFIIGNSHTSEDLAELTTKVETRMAEIEIFGKATKKWLRFSNELGFKSKRRLVKDTFLPVESQLTMC